MMGTQGTLIAPPPIHLPPIGPPPIQVPFLKSGSVTNQPDFMLFIRDQKIPSSIIYLMKNGAMLLSIAM